MGEAAEAPPRARRPQVRFSSEVGRAICRRVAQGETIQSICRDEGMPARGTVTAWAKAYGRFGRALRRAQELGGWDHEKHQRPRRWCEATAMEIFTRLAGGEALSRICEDPGMPGMSTVHRWRDADPEFAERLTLARQVQAERFCDLGWEIASAVTPKTAYATWVQLGQLRWTAAALWPARFGRFKAVAADAEAEAGDGGQVVTFRVRHFQRVVGADGKAYVTEVPDLPEGMAAERAG